MYVGGSVKQLGNWDPLKAKRMKRGVDGNWEVFLYLPRSADILYQYILKDFDGEVVWEGQLERQQRVQDSDRYSMIMQVRDSISVEEGAATGQMIRTPRGTLKPWIAELHQPDATINVKTPWVAEYDSPQAQVSSDFLARQQSLAARDSVLPLPAFDNTKAYMSRPSFINKHGRPSESGFEDCLDPNAPCARMNIRASTSGFQVCLLLSLFSLFSACLCFSFPQPCTSATQPEELANTTTSDVRGLTRHAHALRTAASSGSSSTSTRWRWRA
eukprot:2816891-Rhodomonas_salina.2